MTALESPARRGWTGVERSFALAMLCLAFFTLEIAGGSSLAFASLIVGYVLAVALAIRSQGGVSTLFGALILYYATQHVLLSQIIKAFLGERPDARLDVPLATVMSEIVLMLGFAAAGIVGGLIHPNRGRPLFPPINDPTMLRRIAVASTVLALLRQVLLFAGVNGLLRQLNLFDSIAIMASVAVAVTESRGKRLTNSLAWITVVPLVLLYLIASSRGVFVYLVMGMVVAGLSFGYRFKPSAYATMLVFGLLFFFIISPYSLRARSANRTPDFMTNVNASIDTFTKVASDPLKYQFMDRVDRAQVTKLWLRGQYYDLAPGSALDAASRMALIRPNDLIVAATLKEGTTGWTNILPAVPTLLPAFLRYEENNYAGTGNALAHRSKYLSPGADHTTGITIGPTADAFSAFGWWGVFLLPFGVLLLNILVFKLMVSLDLKTNAFALALLLASFDPFSEATIVSLIRMCTWSAILFGMAFYIVTRAVVLLDFRHLRPRAIPAPWTDESLGVPADAR